MIICAALKVTDYDAPTGFQETVIPCWRHSNGYSILNKLCPKKMLYNDAIEGFIDHDGKFLTREEAYDHALKCVNSRRSCDNSKPDAMKTRCLVRTYTDHNTEHEKDRETRSRRKK